MKLQEQRLTYYVYLSVGANKDYKTIVKKFVSEKKKQGWKLDWEETCSELLRYPSDEFSDGRCGSPIWFYQHPTKKKGQSV